MAGALHARVQDGFLDGRGFLRVVLFGLVPIARFEGEACDRGEALRGLAELPWRPWAFRQEPPLSWTHVGSDTLRGTFDDGQTRVSVDFAIDAEGHVLSVRCTDRPRRVGHSVLNTPWSGVFRDYQELDGIRVPTYAEASWDLPTGSFTYWRGRLRAFRVLR